MSEARISRIGAPDVIPASDGSLTVSLQIRILRRGKRKTVTLPDGSALQPHKQNETPTPIQLALARGHRWLAMLESGDCKTLTEVAERDGMDRAYVSRMVNLTTLAPDIVEVILEDALPDHLTLFDVAVDPPALWEDQRKLLKPTQRLDWAKKKKRDNRD